MSEQKTHAEIIAEMRFHGQQNIDAEKDKPEYGILTMEGRITQNYADRLDAAHKRERGDCAKLREALCEILSYVESFHKYITPRRGKRLTALFAVADTILSKASAALAAPPRNCDLYADEQSAWEAFSEKRQGPDSSTEEYEQWLFEKATA